MSYAWEKTHKNGRSFIPGNQWAGTLEAKFATGFSCVLDLFLCTDLSFKYIYTLGINDILSQ